MSNQPTPEAPATLKVGALAERAGLTVRTLHHYEEVGLLEPLARTAAGHRLYGPSQVSRLHQITSLRQLGLSLEEIRETLDRPGASLESVLRLQVTRLRERIARQEALAERLEEMIQRLERGSEELSLAEMADSVGRTVRLDRYYSPEQLARMQTRAEVLGAQAMHEAGERWSTLFEGFARALRRGMPADHPKVAVLARAAAELIEAFTGGDAGVHDAVMRLYDAEGPDRVLGQQGVSLPPGVWEYMAEARRALEND